MGQRPLGRTRTRRTFARKCRDKSARADATDAASQSTTTTSADGALPIGKPFLLSIYGAATAANPFIKVSINGEEQLTSPQHTCPSGLRGDTPTLHIPRGALAERKLYRGSLIEAQIAQVQRELLQKNDIAAESSPLHARERRAQGIRDQILTLHHTHLALDRQVLGVLRYRHTCGKVEDTLGAASPNLDKRRALGEKLAEEKGFEPLVMLPPRRFSKPVP